MTKQAEAETVTKPKRLFYRAVRIAVFKMPPTKVKGKLVRFLTIKKLGDMLGISHQRVRDLVTGRVYVTDKELAAIAKALGVSQKSITDKSNK